MYKEIATLIVTFIFLLSLILFKTCLFWSILQHPVLPEDVEEVEAESWKPPEPVVHQTSVSSSMRRTSAPLHISFVENESETVFAIDDKEKETNPEHSKLSEENIVKYISDEVQTSDLLDVRLLTQWDYPIFDLAARADDTVLSRVRSYLLVF